MAPIMIGMILLVSTTGSRTITIMDGSGVGDNETGVGAKETLGIGEGADDIEGAGVGVIVGISENDG